MNTVWSSYIQSIHTLYDTRRLRFSDRYWPQYQPLFGLEGRSRLLEIGCGPGALAESLTRWYPDADVTGIDRDSAFVAFAQNAVPQARFLEGDAAALPFPDESFDGTISNTVVEHIEPSAFYGEQYRVLKPGGQLVQVDAGPDHLRELREIIYPTLKPQRPADSSAPDGFARQAEESVRFALRLDSQEAIADLLAMTPHLYRASAEGRARAAALSELVLTVDVRIVRYARLPAGEISNELTTQSHRS